MILAAGFGTRLGELSALRPKPMLPVCGAPLVRWSALWLAHHGVRNIAVNLHHLGEQIERELGDGSGVGAHIRYSHEQGMILGTGGGLRHARALIDTGDGQPIVVANGKILTDLDLGSVLEAHRSSGAEATLVLRPDPDAARWGSFALDADGRVVRMLQASAKAAGEHPPVATSELLMFTGVHVFEPRFLDRIPAQGEQCVIRTAYRELFHEGRGLHGYIHTGYWWEHSTKERYLQGVGNVLDGACELPFAQHQIQGIDPTADVSDRAHVVSPVYIGPGAKIEAGATVGPYAQIGAGAKVCSGAAVQHSAVWDGAVVEGEVSRQVVVPHAAG